MATIVRFPIHARASAIRRAAAKPARVSSVMSDLRQSEANLTIAAQCGAGIPPRRDFQPLTVDVASPNADETALVPPRASMISDADANVMNQTVVRIMRTCQAFATGETTFSQKRGAIAPIMDSNTIIAGRLKALRKELGEREGVAGGYSQTQFADKLDLTKSTYNPFETGKRQLTFETACLIRRRFGIPVDWLFFGDMPKIENEVLFKLGPEPKAPVRSKRTA